MHIQLPRKCCNFKAEKIPIEEEQSFFPSNSICCCNKVSSEIWNQLYNEYATDATKNASFILIFNFAWPLVFTFVA